MTIIPFTSSEADLPKTGGKAANLVRLTLAGFPVPSGFIIATDDYRVFVDANDLNSTIDVALDGIAAGDAAGLVERSTQVRAAFAQGEIPAATDAAIRVAYAEMGGVAVAVRSSATTEDLPDISFAGQQDTYLNILGEDELLKAVVNCWSSLWTARAIGYRQRNAIRHDDAALAVVVQEMVQSEVSGVLFTANPLTGLLSETVIDATFGLGEALVAGQVEPDHYVVDSHSGEIMKKSLGGKKVSTRSRVGGGVETIEEQAAAKETLFAHEIEQLVMLGQQVQTEVGSPQDIEWAYAGEELYLLQSRPITSLFPVPEVSFDPLLVWMSFGSVQGIMGPITPLGRDILQHMTAKAGTLFKLDLKPADVKLFAEAGERLWVKISDVIRHPEGNRILGPVLRFIEPSVGQILRPLTVDPRLGAGTGKLKLSTLIRLILFALPVLLRLVRNVLRPEKGLVAFDEIIETYLSMAHISPAADRFERLSNIVEFMHEHIANTFPVILPHFIPVIGPGMAALNLLNKLAGEDMATVLETTRGLPRNVTTEMDLALWEVAAEIRANTEVENDFRSTDVETLAHLYLHGDLHPDVQAAIARFMDRYGMRGVGEIDFGQPRWREQPEPVMHTLQSYLNIDPELAPDLMFAHANQTALAAVQKIAAGVRKERGGWLKEKLVQAAGKRMRLLLGTRESPKFFFIRMMGTARRAIVDVGLEFVEAGTISQADDLVYLQIVELESLSRNEPGEWDALIAKRRGAYTRELRRRQVPRVLVSDGRAFYEGIGAETDSGEQLTGSPVSPGAVEGIVHVVFNPGETQMAPGEILVCQGTDPAWTPLMIAADGLITEVGGMMTHGSVVARELGIPAVVGVHQATQRLKNGQQIRLDGSTGKIQVIV